MKERTAKQQASPSQLPVGQKILKEQLIFAIIHNNHQFRVIKNNNILVDKYSVYY